MLLKIFVCLVASFGAGLGTGFAGMSAAAVISPMLLTFLHIPAYQAIGIALASDVLASAVSAFTYYRNKNIDLRHGVYMLLTVLLFTLVGSYISSYIPSTPLGNFSVAMTLFLGLKFLIFPVKNTRETRLNRGQLLRTLESVGCGIYIGFVCGFIGAGGGLMMLFVLTTVLRYDLKTAVGTSTFVMAFTALTGSMSHFAIGGAPDLSTTALCAGFTLLFSYGAARYANHASPAFLNRLVGVVLTALGVLMAVTTVFFS